MPEVRAARAGKKLVHPPGVLGAIQRALTWPARTRSYGIIITLALTSLVVVALLHVWTRLEIIRIGYELSQQSRLHQALVQHNQRLRLELRLLRDRRLDLRCSTSARSRRRSPASGCRWCPPIRAPSGCCTLPPSCRPREVPIDRSRRADAGTGTQ